MHRKIKRSQNPVLIERLDNLISYGYIFNKTKLFNLSGLHERSQ